MEKNRYHTEDGVKIDMWVKDTFKFKNNTIAIYKTGYYRSL
jgi:hypothetical protein